MGNYTWLYQIQDNGLTGVAVLAAKGPFYQHNNENIKIGLIKAILIFSSSTERIHFCMTLLWSSNSGRSESFCDAMPAELN